MTFSDTFSNAIHKARHATGGADAIAPADIGADVAGAAAAAAAASDPAGSAAAAVVTAGTNADTKIADERVTERANQMNTFALIDPDKVTAGESNMPRWSAQSAAVIGSSGYVRYSMFTATKTETINQLVVWGGSVAAGATPSLVRMGVWTCTPAGVLVSLVASTANDTTIFAAINTMYARATQAPFNKVAGQRYAVGVLVVTAATVPQYAGINGPGLFFSGTALPMLTGMSTSGQTDLPASNAGSSSGNALAPYMEMRP